MVFQRHGGHIGVTNQYLEIYFYPNIMFVSVNQYGHVTENYLLINVSLLL